MHWLPCPGEPRRSCCAAEHLLSSFISLSRDCKCRMAVGCILHYRCGTGMSYLFIFVLWTTEISLQHPSRSQCHCPCAIRGSYQEHEQCWQGFLVDSLHAAVFSQVWGASCLCFTGPNSSNRAVRWIFLLCMTNKEISWDKYRSKFKYLAAKN